MTVYDVRDSGGRLFAFEVSSIVGRRGVVRVIERIPSVRSVKRVRGEEFCEFEVDGVNYVVLEPFGDNSRYWIGPKERKVFNQTAKVREVFERAKLISALFGWGSNR